MHHRISWLFYFLTVVLLLPVNKSYAVGINIMDTVIVIDSVIRPAEIIQEIDSVTVPPVPSSLPPNQGRANVAVPGKTIPDDETPSSVIPWYTEEQLQNPFTMTPNYVDTTLVGFQMYDFAAEDGYFYASRGNAGHAYRPLRFDMNLSPGIRLREYDYYDNYLLKHEDVKYYRPKHVFSDLFYLIGSNREQLFYAKHAQKFHETLHMGIHYRVVNSIGLASRIGSGNSNFYFTGDYLSPDSRYQLLTSVIFNNNKNMESGGLRNYLNYELDPNMDSVYMYQAQSQLKDFAVNLRHFYQTGFYTGSDSATPPRFINLGRINHDFTYKRTSLLFSNESQPWQFYESPLWDEKETFDSTVVHLLENLVSWSNYPLSNRRGRFPFNFKIYIKHSINTILQPDQRPEGAPTRDTVQKRIYYHTRNNFSEIVQGAELQSDQSRFLSIGGYANITLGGYHDDDFHSGAYLNFGRPERKYKLRLMLRYSMQEAPYFYSNMSVNNVRWSNNFEKMHTLNFGGRLQFPWVTLEGNYFLLNNMVYLGKDALPVQNTTELGLFSLGAYSYIKFGWFGFRNHILLQKATSENFERFPEIMSYHSMMVNFSLFDNALISQVGFDFHFNTPYQAMAYMPMIRGFYIQNDYTTAPKYLLDIFWNAKISNARLFVKYQNILGLVLDRKPVYEIPFYPVPETMFKFGVSWMFFN